MIDESDVRQKVTHYLRDLGFDESAVAYEISSNSGQIADFVVYREDKKPLAVIEVKSHSKDYPRSSDSKLRFHPYVRQAQFLADQFKAQYYSLSDGTSFLWFRTDSSGWPSLLENPISPPTSVDVLRDQMSKAELVRVLQELQQFVFWRGGAARPEATAIVILAKVMSELGDNALFHSIVESRWSESSLPFFSEAGVSALISDLVRPQKTGRNLAEALSSIDHICFTEIDPKIVLSALDETILSSQADHGPWRINRWLADFMVRLAQPSAADLVLDVSASYGDILAAVRLNYPEAQLAGIIRHSLSAVWAKIQQLLLRHPGEVIFKGTAVPRELIGTNLFGQPHCIITAPSFGTKVDEENDPSKLYWMGVRNVEDLILELALDWVTPGGRVVMLVPDGLLFSGGKRQLTREMILNQSNLRGVISLAPGLLSSTSVLKSSLLIFDKNLPNNSTTFLGNLEAFKGDDTFDCREISTVNEILEAFWQTEREPTTATKSSSENARVIRSNDLEANDLTVGHYLSPALGEREASRYPLLSLERVSKTLARGRSLRLRDDGEVPVIGPAMIRSLDLDKSAIKRASRVELPPNAPTVDRDDVLLNLIGTHLGEAALVNSELAGSYISGHVALVRPDTRLVSPEYLAIALNSQHAKLQIGKLFTGALIKGLPLSRLRKLTVPIPDLTTQREIVAAINRVKRELDEAKRQTEILETKYLELVGSVTSLGVPE